MPHTARCSTKSLISIRRLVRHIQKSKNLSKTINGPNSMLRSFYYNETLLFISPSQYFRLTEPYVLSSNERITNQKHLICQCHRILQPSVPRSKPGTTCWSFCPRSSVASEVLSQAEGRFNSFSNAVTTITVANTIRSNQLIAVKERFNKAGSSPEPPR